jgi:PAS domain S-box-containing protein
MSNVKILVVEDESIVAMDIKQRAESLGYTVTAVTPSGEEAVQKAEENTPDLVLMDIVLKGEIDGIEAAQRIRDAQDIPIVYLTAYSDEKTLKRARVTEPFGYIIKPFEDRELHSAVEMALYKHKMESKLKESEKWLSTTLESIGDAVIATDKDGSIKFMNPVAAKVTGWDPEESMGKPLADVFKLVNEKTDTPIENPVAKVVQEDALVELNEPTLLIKKDGTMVPIDDSSAPIKDKNGDFLGVALIFRDIRERRKAEREREELLKEKARGELSSFVLSALPVFASNIPPQIRNNIAKSFSDRFERNMKPKFKEELERCTESCSGNGDTLFECYISWLSEFFMNLGVNSKHDESYIKLMNCPWINEESSPMFCLICRAIIMRSFTWTQLKGNVEQKTCMADCADNCAFKFFIR